MMLSRSRFVYRTVHNGKDLARRTFARREAPLPPLTNPVENAIAAAQQRGDLNNLSGSGKPLQQGVDASRVPTGMTSSELLSKKAEFEMRRAIKNNELDHLQGQKLEYKGTSIVSSGLGTSSASGSDGDGPDAMSRYILEQAQPSAKDMKKL